MEIKGRTILITGAAKRIGRACALSLASRGADIVVHYRSSEEEARSTAAEIEKTGSRAYLLQTDLSREDQVQDLFLRAVQETGGIDILVNSASIFPPGNFATSDWDEYLQNSRVNALAPLLLSRLLAEQGRSGCIINFLDTRMHDYDKEHFPYHLSKRSLYAQTRALALELAPKIRVNGIAPGLILPPPGQDYTYLESRRESNPLKSIGSLPQITDSLLYLIENDFVTGQILYVDGGRHLKSRLYS